MSFVDVPASAIRQRLAAAGFQLIRADHSHYGEEIYERAHDKDSRYTIKVYSSIRREALSAIGCGKDAIRVVALFTVPGKVYPIFKSARVYRTGTVDAVLDRMIERARKAYAACGSHRRRNMR